MDRVYGIYGIYGIYSRQASHLSSWQAGWVAVNTVRNYHTHRPAHGVHTHGRITFTVRGRRTLFLTTVSNEFAGGVQELAVRFRNWR